jgi:hypothetical protein
MTELVKIKIVSTQDCRSLEKYFDEETGKYDVYHLHRIKTFKSILWRFYTEN